MSEMGILVRLEVNDETVHASIFIVFQLVQDIVTSVVSTELERTLVMPPPPLFFSCSDICWKVRKELSNFGINCQVQSGRWMGIVDGLFTDRLRLSAATRTLTSPFKHDWLEISYGGVTLCVDPTFIQFVSASTEWSFEMCVQAAIWCQM